MTESLYQPRTFAKSMRRWSLSLAIIAAACGVCLGEDPSTLPVENALLKTIEATRVPAEVAGKVAQINVSEGDRVKSGERLGLIRDSAIRLQLSRAKIVMAIARKKQRNDVELRLAQKRADVAKNEFQRAQSANARIPDTYPPKEIDRLQLVAESSELEIERARHDLELFELDVMAAENDYHQAEELLARHQVDSPVDGVVVSIDRRAGEWVEPGTELLQIVKIDRLRIEGFVNGAASGKLRGRPAQVTVLRGDEERVVPGKVVFVSPDANPVNGQVRVFLEIDNAQAEFLPGMRVRATIDLTHP